MLHDARQVSVVPLVSLRAVVAVFVGLFLEFAVVAAAVLRMLRAEILAVFAASVLLLCGPTLLLPAVLAVPATLSAV